MKQIAASALLIVVTCILGCGYKTSPRPASATRPEQVLLITARAYPDRIELTWDVPKTNTDGSPLKDLSGFKVFRAEAELGEDCKDCDVTGKLYTNVDAQDPTNAVIRGGNVIFEDKGVTQGKTYRYAVVPYNLKGRDGPMGATITVPFGEPPPRPRDLTAKGDDRGIVLNWLIPTRTLGIRSYRIYRSDTGNEEDLKPYATTKWAEKFFLDEKVEGGKTYAYQVTSVKMVQGIPMESRPSRTVRILVPKGRIPPPEDINVLSTAKGITIYWNPVKVTGKEIRYDVYRSESGKPFVKINRTPLSAPSFTDEKVKKGRTYRYAVKAYPKGRPSEASSRSASEAVKHIY